MSFPRGQTSRFVFRWRPARCCGDRVSWRRQRAGIAALEGSQEEVQSMVAEFDRRRRLVVDGLRRIPGVTCPEPEGAFYVFPSIEGTGLSSSEFEERAMGEAGVALLSGSAFGEFGEGYVRLSYANSQENIRRALEKLERFARGVN